MAKLTASKRANLKPSQFGIPGKAKTATGRKKSGSFPIPDKSHARSALRFIKDAPASKRPAIRAKADRMLGKKGSAKKK